MKKQKKIFIETLGCKINQYESESILNSFLSNEYKSTDKINDADVIVINTCTVTNRTDYKSRYLIAKATEIKEINPDIKIVITGCYSQRFKDEITEQNNKSPLNSPLIDFIVDNNKKNHILDFINNSNILEKDFSKAVDFQEFSEMSFSTMSEHSRAFLKIQDGCDCFCSYCAVPYARGKPRSRSVNNIKHQVETLLSNGYEEIVLSGINLGLFKGDLTEHYDLSDLITDLSGYQKLKKIRLSSIEPQLFTDKLINTIRGNEKVSPHFHIPLQTGNDYLLKLHNRRYDISQFSDVYTKLKNAKENVAFGFDVIVGLPGETENLFEETFRLLESLEFTYLHVFIYSKRKNTLAATMKNQVHGNDSKRRSKLLIDLAHDKKELFINKLLTDKTIISGVAENYINDLYSSTSDRFIKAYFKSREAVITPKKLYTLMPLKKYIDGIICEVYND